MKLEFWQVFFKIEYFVMTRIAKNEETSRIIPTIIAAIFESSLDPEYLKIVLQ